MVCRRKSRSPSPCRIQTGGQTSRRASPPPRCLRPPMTSACERINKPPIKRFTCKPNPKYDKYYDDYTSSEYSSDSDSEYYYNGRGKNHPK